MSLECRVLRFLGEGGGLVSFSSIVIPFFLSFRLFDGALYASHVQKQVSHTKLSKCTNLWRTSISSIEHVMCPKLSLDTS
jgi:hypothetical protein